MFDVGAHLGEDSAFYLKLGYRVVAVEANPALAAHLAQRFAAEIEQGRLMLVDKAIAASPGQVPFYINAQSSVWGTAVPAWAERNARYALPRK